MTNNTGASIAEYQLGSVTDQLNKVQAELNKLRKRIEALERITYSAE